MAAKRWQPPRCPSAGEWMRHTWSTPTAESHSAARAGGHAETRTSPNARRTGDTASSGGTAPREMRRVRPRKRVGPRAAGEVLGAGHRPAPGGDSVLAVTGRLAQRRERGQGPRVPSPNAAAAANALSRPRAAGRCPAARCDLQSAAPGDGLRTALAESATAETGLRRALGFPRAERDPIAGQPPGGQGVWRCPGAPPHGWTCASGSVGCARLFAAAGNGHRGGSGSRTWEKSSPQATRQFSPSPEPGLRSSAGQSREEERQSPRAPSPALGSPGEAGCPGSGRPGPRSRQRSDPGPLFRQVLPAGLRELAPLCSARSAPPK